MRSGQRFGRLTVVAQATRADGRQAVVCRCDCGNERTIRVSFLLSGNTQSCGCLRGRSTAVPSKHGRHGLSSKPEYSVWKIMKSRCLNPNDHSYAEYGARGIHVSQSWSASFRTFYADMGPRPSSSHSIERIDNNGDYCKENCKWATRDEQSNNKRDSHFLTYGGETLTIDQWAKRKGMRFHTLQTRIGNGWTVERALNTPVRSYKRHDTLTIST